MYLVIGVIIGVIIGVNQPEMVIDLYEFTKGIINDSIT